MQTDTTNALCKLLTDEQRQKAFQNRFQHTVEEYISALFTDEEAAEIVQLATIVNSDEDIS